MVGNKNNIELITIPNSLLRKRSKEVKLSEIFSENFKRLIKEMAYIVYQYDALGLSAVQVGILKKVFIIRKDPEKEIDINNFWEDIEVFINPEIIEYSSDKSEGWEGCLSIPNLECLVERRKEISVKYINMEGKEVQEKLTQLKSIVFQHEYDHTLGVLILDKAKEIREIEGDE